VKRLIAASVLLGLLCLPALAFWQSRDSNYNQSIVSGGGGVTGWCSLIPQGGLVNCWPFDSTYTTTSTATDPIGGKNATLTNVTLNGSGPSTNLNNAAVCNGTSSHGDTALSNLPTTAFSLVVWVNRAGAIGNRIMADDHTDSDFKGFQVRDNGGTVFLDTGNGTTTTATDSNAITTNTWTMLTWTYSGTTVTPYTNTTAGTAGSFTGPIAAPTNNTSFCFNPAYSGDFYAGKLAGVAIYNRPLTSGEVATINGL
jgi:hypothetical protein